MKGTLRQTQGVNPSIGIFGKRIVSTTLATFLAAIATVALADVASGVLESKSTDHKGVLAFVRDSTPQGRRTESLFFGQGMRKVSAVAPDFQIQIVEPKDIPGGALPGSFVVLTPAGDRVVAMRRDCKTTTDLRDLIVSARGSMGEKAPPVAEYFEYDH